MLTKQTALIVTLGLGLLPLPSIAQTPWTLVAPGEDARDRAAPHLPAPPDLPPPPTINLLQPDLSRPLRNPVTIEVHFGAGPGRTIDMQSFKATYGWLGLNITSRLLEHSVSGPASLTADNVNLPLGNHRVTISIADSYGKVASRTFEFSVAQ
jgi:hypothetical protein